MIPIISEAINAENKPIRNPGTKNWIKYNTAALTKKPTTPLPYGVILLPVRDSINQPTTMIARAASIADPNPDMENPGTKKATIIKTITETIKRMM
jgi:hypothetical protein